ncbi:MAG TPA: winged helix-turn-helix domain-containing protein [Gaiellaceae bacterium]
MNDGGRNWAFLTSHAFVLIEVARNSDVTVREIAKNAELTERQAHRVLADLVDGGYIVRQRVGRRNHYSVNGAQPMRRSAMSPRPVSELLQALTQARS